MAQTIEVRVPNIGDFVGIPVLDVLVAPGDTIVVDDPIVTLESEKATMDVPSPQAGVVESVAVKAGDVVSEGSIILVLAAAASAAPPIADGATAFSSAQARSDAATGSAVDRSATVAPATVTIELRVPDIGGFDDVTVIDVFVKAGDRVERESPLIALETDKATMEVPSTDAGIIGTVAVKIGDRVSQGTLLATVTATASAASAAPIHATNALPPPAPAKATSIAPVAPQRAMTSASVPADPTPLVATNGVVHASPAIRRFARELGVDLHDVVGSGPHARITRDDVAGHVKSVLARPAGEARRPSASGTSLPFELPPPPRVDYASFGEIERVALSRIRKIAGPSLHRNWISIPHVTNNDEADVTELEAFRKRLGTERSDVKVTMLAFAIVAAVSALRAYPDVNSSLDGDALVLKRYYNIGFAADTPSGLVVPVLRDADSKGIFEIAAETAALAKKAREGKLTGAEMSGGTFTISSLGGIGGTSFTPIINAPEVAILGLSRAATKPVWDGHAFAPRLMLPLSLSYDHRVIDGALAARFNVHLASVLADFRRALL